MIKVQDSKKKYFSGLYDEEALAMEVINDPTTLRKDGLKTRLICYIKYLKHTINPDTGKIYTKKEVGIEVEKLLHKNGLYISDFNNYTTLRRTNFIDTLINKYNQAKNYEYRHLEPIHFNYTELEKLKALNDPVKEKILFQFMIFAKASLNWSDYKEMYQSLKCWGIEKKLLMVFKNAGFKYKRRDMAIDSTKHERQRFDYLCHTLETEGLIKLPNDFPMTINNRSYDYGSITIGELEQTDGIDFDFTVNNMDAWCELYMKWRDGENKNLTYCERCGRAFKNPSKTKKAKVCPSCAKEIDREKARERMRKKRQQNK